MKRVWRYLWRTTATLFVLLAVSLFIISQLDLNQFKPTIESQVSELTGRQFKIEGNLQIDFSLNPQIIIEKVSFDNASWGRQPQMLSLEKLEIKTQILPLIHNKLVIERLLISGVDLSIETNEDGQNNWQFEKLANNESATNKKIENSDTNSDESFQLPVQLAVDEVQLISISIHYNDAVSEIKTDTNLNKLQLTNNVTNKAREFLANGTINNEDFSFTGMASFLADNDTAENKIYSNSERGLNLQFNADALGISLATNGTIKQPTLFKGVNIKFTLNADNLDDSFTAATGTSIYQYIEKKEQPLALNISADFSDADDGYYISNLKLLLADNDISGNASFILNPGRPIITANLESEKINVNQFYKEQQKTQASLSKPTKNSDKKDKINKPHLSKNKKYITLPDIAIPYALLNTLNAEISYQINNIEINEFKPKDVNLKLSLKDGLLDLSQLDLNLDNKPIQSSLKIDNSAINAKQPKINIELNIEHFQLSYLSRQLEIEQLKSGILHTDIKLNTNGKNLKSLVTNLKGKAKVQLTETILTHQIGNKKRRADIQQFNLDFTGINKPLDYSLNGVIDKQALLFSGQIKTLSSILNNETGEVELKLNFDENDVKGNIQFNNRSERPEVIAKLESNNIDLNQLLPDQGKAKKATTKKSATNSAIKASTISKKSSTHAKQSVIQIPDTTLPFELLNVLNATFTYDIKHLHIDEFKPQEIKLNASLQNGLLDIKQFDLNINDKPIRSSLIIDNDVNNINNQTKTPKLNIKLNIDSLQLSQVSQRLQIEQIISGTLHSEINLNTHGKTIKSLVLNTNGLANIRLLDAKLEHKLKNKKHTATVKQFDFDFSGIEKTFNYKLDGDINGSAISAYGHFDSPISMINNEDLKLKIDLEAVGAKLAISGDINQPLETESARLKFSLNIPNPRDSVLKISNLIPEVKPNEAIPVAPFSIQGLATAMSNTYNLEDIIATLGNNDISGKVSVDLQGEKPIINATFNSQLLDLNTLAPTTKQNTENENNQKTSPTLKSQTNPRDKTKKLFSQEPLPALDFLDDVDLNLSFNLKRLISNNQKVDNISLTLNLKDSLLKIDPLALDLAKGTLVSTLEINATKKPTFRFNEKITNLNYGRLLTILGMKEYAKGDLNADIYLTGEGDSVRELMAGLNGKVRVTTVDGTLDSSALKFLSKDIVSIIPFTDTSNRQKINCGVVQFNINNGIASTHSMVVNTGAISALGTGDIDLTKENLALYVAPRSKRTSIAKLALVPVNITGALSSPSITPDITGSTISATKTYANVSLTVATGGLWLLAEGYTNKLWDKFIDNTDYCARALAGNKIVPGRIKLEDDADRERNEEQELMELLDDDENDW